MTCKNILKIMSTALFLVTGAVVLISASSHPMAFTDGRKSKVWLVGDSSLHAYSSVANKVNVEMEFHPATSAGPVSLDHLKLLKVTVPVKEMRSGRNQLDKNMQGSLKADSHPDIVFQMSEYEIVPATFSAKESLIKVKGTLEVAGVKQDIELEGRVTEEEGMVRIQGVQGLLMTDYGIKPPKILMIKTSNEVKIHFDLWIDQKGILQ